MAEPLQDPGTPEELEFEDDDGTMYRWDPLLRKYMPTGDAAATAHEAEQQTDAAAQQPAQQQSEPHEQQQQQQQQQQEQQEYDLEAMTYEAQEEVVPTLAAVRAAEEAALAGASGAPGGPQQRAGGKRPGGAPAEGRPQDKRAKQLPGAGGDGSSAAGAQQPGGWFELKRNTSVYVTGLPDDTDADEVAQVFAKCGILKLDDEGQPRIKLYRHKESGLLKGDALVTYLKEPSVQLACTILDGTPLRAVGPSMAVTSAKFEMKGAQYQQQQQQQGGAAVGGGGQAAAGGGGGSSKPQQQANKQQKKGKGGKRGGGGGGRGGGGGSVAGKLERRLGWGGFDDVLPPEKVTVVLRHMFDPAAAVEGGHTFVGDLEADVTEECSKLGTIEKVRVFAAHPQGVVTVRFKTEEAAAGCIALMHQRFFDGRRIEAAMWDGFTSFHSVKWEPSKEAAAAAAAEH